jgi:hypothetical protein
MALLYQGRFIIKGESSIELQIIFYFVIGIYFVLSFILLSSGILLIYNDSEINNSIYQSKVKISQLHYHNNKFFLMRIFLLLFSVINIILIIILIFSFISLIIFYKSNPSF